MTWREFLLKSFAHKRMEEEKLQHMRFIAYKTTLAPHLNPKYLPKSIQQFFPIGNEIQISNVSEESKQMFLEKARIYYANKKN